MLIDPPSASPSLRDRLSEEIRLLYAETRGGAVPVGSLGLLQRDGPEQVAVIFTDMLGTSGHRDAAVDVTPIFLGSAGRAVLTAQELEANQHGMLEALLCMPGMPDDVRQASAARAAVLVPLPEPHAHATLIVGLTSPDRPSDAQMAAIESMARRMAAAIDRRESPDDELTRLRRLASLEDMMGALIPILDVREIFERLSTLSRGALHHDFLSVALFSDDRTRLSLYAQTSGWAFPESGPVQFAPVLVDTFTYHLVDDLLEHPLEANLRGTQFGARSSLRVPVRLNDATIAAINFSSMSGEPYRGADVFVAQRIAKYVALAMSHQRLADESRRASALEERAKNLEVLDGLLNTITGVLDIREVFDRVSEIARRVLPHDMMALPLNAGNGTVRVYAVAGGVPSPSPRVITLAEAHRRLFHGQWEHIIYDDIQQEPFEQESPPGQAGYRSLLRVAIRLEGELAGVLDFASFTPSFYTSADAVIGRRIADHVALTLSHQRLAEQSLRAAALEERAANLQMLDSLLSAISGALDIREVFTRISEIASRVLPHDAMSLPIFTDDRQHVIPYATTFPDGVLPQIIPLPESQRRLVTEHWDSHIADDIHTHPDGVNTPMAGVGMHSLLRVPIRLEGELVGMLAFFSRQIGAYTQDDAILAKRIASHVALVVSHQRLADESRRAAALQERQANLEVLDGLLKTLTGVLDVRQVFARVSEISQRVLPHDGVAIGEVMPDGEHIRMYAGQGLGVGDEPFVTPIRDRSLVSEPWDYRLFDDISTHPHYSASNSATVAGMHSVLFVPIRLGDERLYGALTFYAKATGRFTRDDVLIATRIADHIALALQHERLAEQMRQSEELRSRTANIGLLDALLAAVTDTGDLQSVVDRVSEIAQKVLPYDAMVLPILQPDAAHLRFHVVKTPGAGAFPDVFPVPAHLRGDWDYEVVDDMSTDPRNREHPIAKLGYRSCIRVAIRVEGQLTAGVGFFALKPAVYKEADVLIARRIAARLAISLMREQGMAASKRADEAAERASRLESRVQALTDELNSRAGFHRVIGKSAGWRQVLTQSSQVAATETTVLLLGESGTGKEVVARFLHRASARKNGPFVALNCAALPEQLLESELFGYERGAFTGAMVSRAGKIEQAAGGVLFLDEVGEMSPAVQAKFLRVLQEREFQRLGGAKTLKADARVIAATNRDPKTAMERGQFREDLYYRLSVFEIALPPLRERRDDILLLVESFLSDLAKSVGRPAAGLSEDAKDRLLGYSWPGNVRELRNAIERAVILCEGGLISSEHLPIAVGQARSAPAPAALASAAPSPAPGGNGGAAAASSPGGLKLDDLERDLLNKAMAQSKNNKSQAAKLLGVPRGQFYSLLKKHGLTDAKR
jgi:transcriptional regulator with GAF, ATPase, and Fis domain